MRFSSFQNVRLAARLCLAVAVVVCAATLFAEEPVLTEPPISASDRDHWAYRPLVRPNVPKVKNSEWCRNEIDAFILAKLEAAGLSPMTAASRGTLLRRLSFDLTGLPPKAGEDVGAPEACIERLLSSPAYGERWGQHWLDLARFADTDGFEHDLERPNAWRYRDWVIGALNRDMPYDEFLRLQLAGDELAPQDAGALVATGFLLSGPDMPDLNSQDERRHVVLNDMTATLGSVVLGLQVGCAQCNDHKYDAISQADFYRLRSFFEPAEFFKEHPLPLPGSSAKDKVTSRTLLESSAKSPESRIMVRGDFRRPGAIISPEFLRVVNVPSQAVTAPAEKAPSTGRRSQLAQWLTRPDHPLTARVIVNRVWQYHFGRGLTSTPSDFGVMGNVPTHPELLDWLAATFVAPVEQGGCGWSLKRLHRLVLTSASWQQASRTTEPGWSESEIAAAQKAWDLAVAKDPANDLWSRMPRTRLEGEAIRDAMLASSERLSDRRGGPGVRPPLPAELVVNLLKNHWVVSPDPIDHRRRSIYLFARRNLRYPLFEAFDRPDANSSCAVRTRSTIAPQALFLLNSELSLASARDLAELVRRTAGTSRELQIQAAWLRTLSRPPTDAERNLAIRFLSETPYETLVDLCLALFNTNEFVYVD
jgi:hypothetical protein